MLAGHVPSSLTQTKVPNMSSDVQLIKDMLSTMSPEAVHEINRFAYDLSKKWRAQQNVNAAMKFRKGDRVKFKTGRKRGYPAHLTGTITKVMRVNAQVDVPHYGTWRVSLSSLSAA